MTHISHRINGSTDLQTSDSDVYATHIAYDIATTRSHLWNTTDKRREKGILQQISQICRTHMTHMPHIAHTYATHTAHMTHIYHT